MEGLTRAELIELLDRYATPTATAAADALRGGSDFTAEESSPLPGEHFAQTFRRRRLHASAINLDVQGMDEAIASFEQADEVGGLAFITAVDRRYSVYLAPAAADAVIACLSTRADSTA